MCGKKRLSVLLCAVAAVFIIYMTTGEKENAARRTGATPEHLQQAKIFDDKTREDSVIFSLGESPDKITVSWSGTRKEAAFFRYAKSPEELANARPIKAKREKLLDDEHYRYSVSLEGIKGGSTYYYELGDDITYDGDEMRKFTAPDDKGSVRFMYLGDVQLGGSASGHRRWSAMVGNACRGKNAPDFILTGGDMVNVPSEQKEWDNFLKSCAVIGDTPVMAAAGNHEGVSSNKTFKKIFALPDNGPDTNNVPGCAPDGSELKENFYSFVFGCCRITVLDSSFLTAERRNAMGKETWQRCEKIVEEWLADIFMQNKAAWNIVVVHHPPYGVHDSEVSAELRNLWLPIMEKGGVDLVLCGHQHMYMRTCGIKGITYIMGNSADRESEYYNGMNEAPYIRKMYAGGWNHQMIEASQKYLRIVSVNEKGLIIDETCLKKSLLFHILEFFGSNQVIVQSA